MEEQFVRRIRELAKQSYDRGQYTYTGFLNEAELSDVYQIEREISYAGFTLFGGTVNSTRKMVQFGTKETIGYTEEFPITCIIIEPVSKKFGEELSHRDYLGALMNLGIDRTTIGGIYVKDKTGFLFCHTKIADYIVTNLNRIKHTSVTCKVTDTIPEAVTPAYEEVTVLVSSPRQDGIIAKLLNLSRSDVVEKFRMQQVFINGRLSENNSGQLKCGDVVSVRGAGKFVYQGIECETKKGKYRVKVSWYR